MGSCGNLEEADEASSTRDFINKMKIALREAKESHVWLRALRVCQLAHFEKVSKLEQEAKELSAIFARIVINTKRRQKEERKVKKERQRTPNRPQ